jgi:hypothetical protein
LDETVAARDHRHVGPRSDGQKRYDAEEDERLAHEFTLTCRFRWTSFDVFVRSRMEEHQMRVMVLVKANEESESGVLPSTELLAAMGEYNEELVKAGIMLDGEGLHPSSKGARIQFSGDQRSVIDGPFTETKELIAGYWIWQVRDLDEAIEWAKRCPNPTGAESVLELRPVFEADDFGDNLTPELREQEDRLRTQMQEQS